MSPVILNFALFQAGWFACVLSGAAGQPFIGALIAVAVIALHLWRANRPALEIKLLLSAMVVGAVWDSLLAWSNLLDYTSGQLLTDTAPYWIIALWGLFATTLNVSLRWLHGRYAMAAVFGLVGGPLAYYGGASLGALDMQNIKTALLALGLGWAIITPVLMHIGRHWDGYAPATGGGRT